MTTDSDSLRIDRLQLKNFRFFAGLTLDLHPRLNVIVADNGQGKTAVLDAIATVLGPFVGAFDEGKDRGFTADDIRLISATSSNRMEYANGGVRADVEGRIAGCTTRWARSLAGPRSRTTWKESKSVVEWAEALQADVRRELAEPGTPLDLPLVAYYPTDRLWNIRRLPYKKIPRTSRTVGYTHCLESGSDFHLMADWFRYWSIASLDRRLTAHQNAAPWVPNEADLALAGIQNSINACLSPSGWGNVQFSVEKQEMVASHPDVGTLPVGMLSDGIRAILTLTADIAFRAVKLNPHQGAQAPSSVRGIVMVDEIDLHLHPGWQQLILPALTGTFPGIQFIVTTHSPQVLSTVSSESIRELRLQPDAPAGSYAGLMPRQELEGAASSQALAQIMHVDPIPPTESAQKLSDYRKLIELGSAEGTEGAELRMWLDQHYGAHHPLLTECDQLSRIAALRARVANAREGNQ